MAFGDTRIGARGDSRIPAMPGRPQTGPRDGRRAAASGRSGRDPYDLATAFERLKRLLLGDAGDGPREDAPARGYYLNILV